MNKRLDCLENTLCDTYMHICIHIYFNMHGCNICMCHKGVVSQTMSIVCAQGTSLQTTEKTTNTAFLDILFGNSDLQNMVIEFIP